MSSLYGGLPIPEQPFPLNDLNGLYQVVDDLPEAYRGEIHARDPEEDEWSKLGYRNSVWLDDVPRAVGDVSASRDHYNLIQYGDILEAVADAVEQYDDVDIDGQAVLSPSGHKLTAHILFGDAATVEPVDGDVIELGLHIQTGHSASHSLKYDVGGERQSSRSIMAAFVSDLHFEQSHQEPFQPGLAYQAVDAMMQRTDTVEQRLNNARGHAFVDHNEALLTLLDHNLDWYLDNPVPILREALDEETDGDAPTLYDTYNAATRALTHESDIPDYRISQGQEAAAGLLETGRNQLPRAEDLAVQALENRIKTFVDADGDDIEPYWEAEPWAVCELAEQRGIGS